MPSQSCEIHVFQMVADSVREGTAMKGIDGYEDRIYPLHNNTYKYHSPVYTRTCNN